MKRSLLIFVGSCWLLFSLVFVAILVQYLVQGSGFQLFGGLFSAITITLGLVHVTGFALAALITFAIGAGLCAHGMVKKER